jgi:hypothetical protein
MSALTSCLLLLNQYAVLARPSAELFGFLTSSSPHRSAVHWRSADPAGLSSDYLLCACPTCLISVPQVEAFVERITGACVGPNRQVRPFLPCLLLLCITARLSCHSDTVTQCGAMSFSPCQCLHHLSHAGGTNDTRGNGTHAKLLGREAWCHAKPKRREAWSHAAERPKNWAQPGRKLGDPKDENHRERHCSRGCHVVIVS